MVRKSASPPRTARRCLSHEAAFAALRSSNIWREFGACPLAFAEYLLIGVAGLLFPGDLLNDEGVNRTADVAEAEPGPPGGPPCAPGP